MQLSATVIPTVGVEPALVESHVSPPLDWILVRLDPPIDRTEGGVLAANQSVPPARTGLVIKAGPGCLSDDGKTRMPMSCRGGDRIMFERAAGKGLPRVPRETTDRRGWAYQLMRDGSVCSVIAPHDDPASQQALDAGAAGVPGRPEDSEVPVSRLGPISTLPSRLRPLQDWMVVRLDARPEELDQASGNGVLRPGKRLHRANGSSKPIRLVENEPEASYDMWSGTVMARNPEGLVTITRCLDGDRMGHAPKIVEVGSRVFLSGGPPFTQKINDYLPDWPVGQEILAREYPCVCGVIAG